jgi:hypothetical protein
MYTQLNEFQKVHVSTLLTLFVQPSDTKLGEMDAKGKASILRY